MLLQSCPATPGSLVGKFAILIIIGIISIAPVPEASISKLAFELVVVILLSDTLTANGTGSIVLSGLEIKGTQLSATDSTLINIRDGLEVDGTINFNTLTAKSQAGNDTLTIQGNNISSTGDIRISPTDDIQLGAVTVSDNKITTTSSNANLEIDASGTGAIEMIPIIIKMANLPTSDPGVAGQLWRSTNDLKISTG